MYDLRTWAIIAAVIGALMWILGKYVNLGILSPFFIWLGGFICIVGLIALALFLAWAKWGTGAQ